MSETFANWVKETTATTGTGTITLAGASSADLMAISDTSIADQDVVPYSIKDGDDREVGLGTYTAAGTLLARTTVLATWVGGVYDDTAPTAINLTGNAEVFITMNSFQAMSKTDTKFTNMLYKDTATLNGTAIDNHVNLGAGASITGTAAQAYDFCTVSGGKDNDALQPYGTSSGGLNNSSQHYYSSIGGGLNNTSSGYASTIAGGDGSLCSGQSAFVGGGKSNTANQNYTTVTGGFSNFANQLYATVSGGKDNAGSATYAYVGGGRGNQANHTHSQAGGGGALTRANYDFVWGATDTDTPAVANNTIRFQGTGGNILIDGAVSSPEADYAEMYEWYDQNPNAEDKVGYFVSIIEGQSAAADMGKIVRGSGRENKTGVTNYLASVFNSPNSATNKKMLGVVSGNPSIIGDSAPNHWIGRHVKNKMGKVSKIKYELYAWMDEWGDDHEAYKRVSDGEEFKEYPQYTHSGILFPEGIPPYAKLADTILFPEVNPAFDHTIPYSPRQERKEWAAIGLLGKLLVHSAEPITASYVDPTNDGRAVNGTRYKVIEIIDNYTVRIQFSTDY